MVYSKVMDRRRNDRRKPAIAGIAGGCLLAMVAACESNWTAPETRARDFIETLVTSPTEVKRLRDIANLSPERHPEELLDDLSARVGLDYLRATQARGVVLNFAQGESRRLSETERTVKVHVTYLQPETSTLGEVRFLVRIEAKEPKRWHIVRVTGDN